MLIWWTMQASFWGRSRKLKSLFHKRTRARLLLRPDRSWRSWQVCRSACFYLDTFLDQMIIWLLGFRFLWHQPQNETIQSCLTLHLNIARALLFSVTGSAFFVLNGSRGYFFCIFFPFKNDISFQECNIVTPKAFVFDDLCRNLKIILHF